MTGMDSKTHSGAGRMRVVLLMVAISLASYFQRTAMSIAGPGIAKEFSLSEKELGAIFSAFVFSYALVMIPAGWLADRIGPRMTLAWVCFGTAATTALTAVSGRPGLGAVLGVVPAFVIVRLLLGVATAPLYPAEARMNANWIELEKRSRIWGWIASGAGIGGALSPILFTNLIARAGWRIAFIVIGVATAALGLAWITSVRDFPKRSAPPQTRPAVSLAQWKALAQNRDLMLVTAGYIGIAYLEYIFFYWGFYYLGQVRHMSADQSAWFTTALWISWTIFAPLGGRLSDALVRWLGLKNGQRIMPIVGAGCSAALVLLATNLENAQAAGVVVALALGLAASTDAAHWTAAIHIGEQDSGAAGGILNTGGNLGGFLGPFLTPWIAARYGWNGGLYFACFMAVMSIVCWSFVDVERGGNQTSR